MPQLQYSNKMERLKENQRNKPHINFTLKR